MITYRLWRVCWSKKNGAWRDEYVTWRAGWFLFGVVPLYIYDKETELKRST